MQNSRWTAKGQVSLPLSALRTLRNSCLKHSASLPVQRPNVVGRPPFKLALILPIAARLRACPAVPKPHPEPGFLALPTASTSLGNISFWHAARH
jgi:hypothetical protein